MDKYYVKSNLTISTSRPTALPGQPAKEYVSGELTLEISDKKYPAGTTKVDSWPIELQWTNIFEKGKGNDWHERAYFGHFFVYTRSMLKIKEILDLSRLIEGKLRDLNTNDADKVYHAIISSPSFIEVAWDERLKGYVPLKDIDPPDWKYFQALGIKKEGDAEGEYEIISLMAADEQSAREEVGKYLTESGNMVQLGEWAKNELKVIPTNGNDQMPYWNMSFMDKLSMILPKQAEDVETENENENEEEPVAQP
jgi:hypothetical protein